MRKKHNESLWLKVSHQPTIHIERANTFWRRFRGLLGRKSLLATEALLLEPCNSVHTLGMHFPIDVIFLTKEDRVLAVYKDVPPGRLSLHAKNARRVLELSAGMTQHLLCFPGERLNFITVAKK